MARLEGLENTQAGGVKESEEEQKLLAEAKQDVERLEERMGCLDKLDELFLERRLRDGIGRRESRNSML